MHDRLLTSLETIFGLLQELKRFTGESRRDYHDRLITPLFASLDEVHDSYCDLFLQLRHWIGERCGDPMSCPSTTLWDLERDANFERSFREVKEQFCRLRRTDERLRDALRADAQMLLIRIRWEEERRFLVLLCHYFLQQGPIAPTREQLDEEIQCVLRDGGLGCWDPPSQVFYERLVGLKDILPTVRLLDSARCDLNQRYMNVRLAYKRLPAVLGSSLEFAQAVNCNAEDR